MREIPLYVVDAFASRLFGGNPAAVCPLTEWLPEGLMQAIASENNLSETAFFVTAAPHHLRWFTPRAEIDFCGHATLASAHVFFNYLQPAARTVTFQTRVGALELARAGDGISMRMPAFAPRSCGSDAPEIVRRHAPVKETEILESRDNYFLVLHDEAAVQAFDPDLAALGRLPFGLCVTARGREVDFVSRYFVPSFGIPEDPVTGSTHATLAPLWGARLGKRELIARQLSRRGGELSCRLEDGSVLVSGGAVTYLEGQIRLPD